MIQRMVFHHNGIKLKINNRKKFNKPPNIWIKQDDFK